MGQQVLRVVGIFFSELLLWLAAASAIEILAVFGAGALCVLTAGFFFEGMKKHPIVMVLGGAVALTGTFLMFREVRGMFWPADLPPPTAGSPTTSSSPPASTGGLGSLCSGWDRDACRQLSGCYWSVFTNDCEVLLFGAGLVGTAPPAPGNATSNCWEIKSEFICRASAGCTWSFGSCLFDLVPSSPGR